MSRKFYQQCYSNAVQESGYGRTSGWGIVEADPDIPREASEACTTYQKANIVSRELRDEAGEPLNLYEVLGDGSYLYVMRTRYGLRDRAGRPNNFFSHAYIFPLNGELLNYPRQFLELARSNFQENEEAARQWFQDWESGAVDSLERVEIPQLKEVLDRLGLTRERYATLIRCVYAQMNPVGNRSTQPPLYIRYDGSEETMRHLLLAIYYGIPYYMRRTLKSSVYAPGHRGTAKHLIFTSQNPEGTYLDPRTGENNILTQQIQSRIDRYGYITYAADNLEFQQFPFYFNALEDYAALLGNTADDLTLKIVNQCYRDSLRGNISERVEADLHDAKLEEIPDDDLFVLFSDGLRCKVRTPEMDWLLAEMLREISDRGGVKLTESIEKSLRDRLNETRSAELREASEQYWRRQNGADVSRYLAMPKEEALDDLRRHKKRFHRLAPELMEQPDGQEIVFEWYQRELEEEKADLTWNTVVDLWDETRDWKNREMLGPLFVEEALNRLYEPDARPGQGAANALEQFKTVVGIIMPDSNDKPCLDRAKRVYWANVNLDNFDFALLDEYRTFQIEDGSCRQYLELAELPTAYAPGGDTVRKKAKEYFEKYETEIMDRTMIVQKLIACLEEQKHCRLAPGFLGETLHIQSGDLGAEEFGEGAEREIAPGYDDHPHAESPDGMLFLPIPEGLLHSLKRYYNRINMDSWARSLISAFEESLRTLRQSGDPNSYHVRLLRGILLWACIENDSPDHPVPLDLWLTATDGAFDIFEKCDAAILHIPVWEVVEKSELLMGKPDGGESGTEKGKYWKNATAYEAEKRGHKDTKSAAYRAVKYWVDYISAPKHKRDGKRVPTSPKFPFFG